MTRDVSDISSCAARAPGLRGDLDAVGAAGLAEVGVVHDLGNLIQVASSAIGLLARNPAMAPASTQVILQRARISLEHASALVRNTVGLVRGRASASPGYCNVAACLDDVATLVDAMGESGLALDMEVEAGLPHARCDPLSLRNAVLNLVFNARDSMPGGGRVVLRAGLVDLGRASPIEISVADTGVGMSSATIERAFDLYFTTKPGGLGGVGLPMVSRFVADTGGTIAVASAPGEGTCVTMRIPAHERSGPEEMAS